MAVNDTHPDYDKWEQKWKRCRDFFEGSDKVKQAGESYLPKLTLQSDDEYQAYKERTPYANYTARTHEGLTGMIFRKDPNLVLPENQPGELGVAMDGLETDCDMQGSDLTAYAREVASDVLLVGRGGTLVDFSKEENRAYLAYYSAESILNCRVERIKGRMMLTLVVLSEITSKADDAVLSTGARSDKDADPYSEVETEQIRVLRLVPTTNTDKAEYFYRIEIWEKQTETSGKGKAQETKTYWEMTDLIEPQRKGAFLTRIPFIFHNPETEEPTVDKPPMLDLVDLNGSHYRVSADFYHGLHFTALPTAWVAGFPKDSNLRIGSSEAWVSENPEARAGYLEFEGKGLSEYSDELERLERRMAILGARMLEAQKREAETEETLRIRQGGEMSVLQHIGGVVSEQLTLAARWVGWWSSTKGDPEEWTDDEILVTLNKDFFDTRIPTQDAVNLTSVWIQGAISRDTLHYNLSQGEILPPGRTLEEEQELIDAEPPTNGTSTGLPEDEEGDEDAEEDESAAGTGGAGGSTGAADEEDENQT